MMMLQQNTGMRRRKTKPNTKKANSPKASKKHWLPKHIPQFDHSKIRFQIVACIFVILWTILWGRAFYLQIVIGPELRTMSSKQHHFTQLVEAKRGNIYDRNGQILARSVEVKSVYAHPKQIDDADFAAKTLAPILSLDEKISRTFKTRQSLCLAQA